MSLGGCALICNTLCTLRGSNELEGVGGFAGCGWWFATRFARRSVTGTVVPSVVVPSVGTHPGKVKQT